MEGRGTIESVEVPSPPFNYEKGMSEYIVYSYIQYKNIYFDICFDAIYVMI